MAENMSSRPTRPNSFGCRPSGTLVHEISHAAKSGHFSDTHWGFAHASRRLSDPFDGRSFTLAGLLQHFRRERWNRRQATRCLHSHSRAGGGLSGVYKDAIKSSLSETLGHSGQCSLHLIQVNQTWLLSPVGNLGLRFHPPSRIESACIGGAWPDSRILVVLEWVKSGNIWAYIHPMRKIRECVRDAIVVFFFFAIPGAMPGEACFSIMRQYRIG